LEFSLSDNFEKMGYFFSPENREQGFYGTLEYSNGDVRIHVVRRQEEPSLIGSVSDHEVLHGELSDGTAVRLQDCYTLQTKNSMLGVQEIVILARYLLMNVNLEKYDSKAISRVRLHFEHLDMWINDILFREELEQTSILLDVTIPRERRYVVTSNGTIHKIGWAITDPRNGLYAKTMKASPYIDIEYALSKAFFSRVVDDVYSVRNFLYLMYGDVPKCISIKVFGDEKPSFGIDVLGMINDPDLQYADIRNPYQFLLHRKAYTQYYRKIVNTWNEKYEELLPILDLLVSSEKGNSYNENRFLMTARALEAYHRKIIKGNYMTEDEWKPYRLKLSNEIPKALDSGHKASIKSRIIYAYQYSFRKRLTDIQNKIPDEIWQRLELDIGKIVDTRNYYTHVDGDEKTIIKGIDMYMYTERMKIVAYYLILSYIGIQQGVLNYAMQEYLNTQYQKLGVKLRTNEHKA